MKATGFNIKTVAVLVELSEMADNQNSLASDRDRRSNAGARMSRLLDAEDDDDFYKTTYGGFTEVGFATSIINENLTKYFIFMFMFIINTIRHAMLVFMNAVDEFFMVIKKTWRCYFKWLILIYLMQCCLHVVSGVKSWGKHYGSYCKT